MARAIELARRGLYTTDPNPRVGCVIVDNRGQVLGEGWHERAGGPHAEIAALKDAGADHLYGATAYVTLEPCCHHGRTPPCTDALIHAGIGHVRVAMLDPNPRVAGKGIKALRDAGVTVDVGLLEHEAAALNPGFISRMTKGRPFIRVKLAASLDGRTALGNGDSKWITGEAARADVQRWRARSSAILTGVSTVLHDDPSLNVRDMDIGRQPLRIVADSTLRMPVSAQMFRLPGETLIVTANNDHERARELKKVGAQVLFVGTSKNSIDLDALMSYLAANETNELHVEAGSTLCGALLHAELVDELVLYIAPHIMGSHARGLFNIPPLDSMSERIKLKIRDVRAVGEDWRFVCDLG